jgi:hypothetical protein
MALCFHCRRLEGEVVLRVSNRALDRAFAATDPGMYQLDPRKIEWMLAFPDGTRLRAPRIAAQDGRIGFINGRHRARAALLQGLKVLPVLVFKDNVAQVREVLARFQRIP